MLGCQSSHRPARFTRVVHRYPLLVGGPLKNQCHILKTSRATAPYDTTPPCTSIARSQKQGSQSSPGSFYEVRKPPRSSKLTSPWGPLTSSGSHVMATELGGAPGIDVELILTHRRVGLTTLPPRQTRVLFTRKGRGRGWLFGASECSSELVSKYV